MSPGFGWLVPLLTSSAAVLEGRGLCKPPQQLSCELGKLGSPSGPTPCYWGLSRALLSFLLGSCSTGLHPITVQSAIPTCLLLCHLSSSQAGFLLQRVSVVCLCAGSW